MTVVALAGRRIDSTDADAPRFPLAMVPSVRARLRELFQARGATALVSSAACGADLIALEVADKLALRQRVVLPFGPERFRETSVTDRPGDWGPAYDDVIERARAAGDLVLLNKPEGGEAYAAGQDAILEEALALAAPDGVQGAAGSEGNGPAGVLAVIVWDGAPRGRDDYTRLFADLARARGVPIAEILTKEDDEPDS